MAATTPKIDLVAVVAELSSSYVVLGRLALAKPLEEDSVLCQIDSLSLVFDSQLLCAVCKSTSVPVVFHTAKDGVLCEKCYNRKVFEPPACNNKPLIKQECESFEVDAFDDDAMMLDVLQCLIKNIEKISEFLLAQANEDSFSDGDESDDPEVQFSFFANRKSPKKKWPQSRSRLILALRDFLSRLQAQESVKVSVKTEEVEFAGNGLPRTPEKSTRKLRDSSSSDHHDELPARLSLSRICKCGSAATTPGKQTCQGQRCPCYTKARGCKNCKCKGCKNTHGTS